MEKFQIVIDPDLEPLMPRYFDIRWRELEEMEQSIKHHDANTTRMLGHKLKGTGTSYGFPKLTELGAAIEIAGKAGDLAEAESLAAEVRSYLENVEIVYAGKK